MRFLFSDLTSQAEFRVSKPQPRVDHPINLDPSRVLRSLASRLSRLARCLLCMDRLRPSRDHARRTSAATTAAAAAAVPVLRSRSTCPRGKEERNPRFKQRHSRSSLVRRKLHRSRAGPNLNTVRPLRLADSDKLVRQSLLLDRRNRGETAAAAAIRTSPHLVPLQSRDHPLRLLTLRSKSRSTLPLRKGIRYLPPRNVLHPR